MEDARSRQGGQWASARAFVLWFALVVHGSRESARATTVFAEFEHPGPAVLSAAALAAAAEVGTSEAESGLALGRWTAHGRGKALPLEWDRLAGVVRLVVPESLFHGRTAVVRFTDEEAPQSVPRERAAGETWGPEVAFRYALRMETNAVLVPANPPSWTGDAAYWRVLLPGHSVLDRLSCPGWVVPGGATTAELILRVGVPGMTQGRCTASLNGLGLGEAEWQGRGLSVLRWSIPEGVVVEGTNRVDWIVSGARGSVVHADQAELWIVSRGKVRGTRWVEATADGVLVLSAAEEGWTVLQAGPGGWRGRVRAEQRLDKDGNPEMRWAARAGEQFWIVDPGSGWRAPSRVWRNRGADLYGGPRMDVRVVLPVGWDGCAPALVETFARQGYRVRVHGLGSIRDGAGHGDADPEAMRNWLLKMAQAGAPPSVVVLIGDGHLDVKGVTEAGENHMPPLLESGLERFRAGDTGLGDLDGDGWPDVVVCRVPVRNEAECEAWLEKRARWFSAPIPSTEMVRALVVSDQPDAAGNFERDANELASGLGNHWAVHRALAPEVGVTGVRNALLEGFGGGADWVHYLGHGGRDRLGQGYLTALDLGSLPAVPRPPVLIGMTCGIGQFALPQSEGLAEALVRFKSGGAMAVWTSEGTALSPSWRSLGQGWVGSLTSGPAQTLADLVRGSIRHHRESGGDLEAVRSLVLLGDALLPVAGGDPLTELQTWTELEGEWLWLGWTGGEGPFRVEELTGWPPKPKRVVYEGSARLWRTPLAADDGRFYRVTVVHSDQRTSGGVMEFDRD